MVVRKTVQGERQRERERERERGGGGGVRDRQTDKERERERETRFSCYLSPHAALHRKVITLSMLLGVRERGGEGDSIQ